jgi:CHAT domain-containing protein
MMRMFCVWGGGQLDELPGAEEEATQVAALLESRAGRGDTTDPGARVLKGCATAQAAVVLLQKQAATKRAVLEHIERSRWIHVACHAHPAVKLRHALPPHLRPDVDGLATRAALFLARPLDTNMFGAGDGVEPAHESLLTVDEILRLQLVRGCVVVLSACCTGQGHTSKSEGIVGLARAFLFAGAASVVCTLWEVQDEAQKLLISRFYALVGKGVDLATSLYQAQCSVRRITQSELDQLDNTASHNKWCDEVQAAKRGIRRDRPPPSTPAGSGVGGEAATCPLGHYKNWAGVIIIGSTHPHGFF